MGCAGRPRVSSGRVELRIGGMTCASCAARIEKKLNRLDGVTATVNFATEKATVTFPADLDPDRLVATVEATGYTARPPGPSEPRDALAPPRTRLLVSPTPAASAVALAMAAPVPFPNWQLLTAILVS